MLRKWFLRIFTFLAVAVSYLSTATEEDSKNAKQPKPKDPGVGYFMAGFAGKIDPSPVQPKLEEKGYSMPPTPTIMGIAGGGGYGLHKGGPLIAGGEGGGGGNTSADEKLAVALGGGEGFFLLGYMVRLSRWLRLYPLLGIGGGGVGVTVGEPDPEESKRPIKDPDKRAAWGEGSVLIKLGFGAELTLGKKSGLILGVRVGYIFDPLQKATGTINMNRPFVHFIIGGGRFQAEQIVGAQRAAPSER